MYQPTFVDPSTNRVEPFRFPLQCVFLKIFGSWPTVDPLRAFTPGEITRGRLYRLYSAVVIFFIFITCCAQSFFGVSRWGDLFTVTECGCTVFMGIHNLIRCMHLFGKRDTMRGLMEEFLANIFVPR